MAVSSSKFYKPCAIYKGLEAFEMYAVSRNKRPPKYV